MFLSLFIDTKIVHFLNKAYIELLFLQILPRGVLLQSFRHAGGNEPLHHVTWPEKEDALAMEGYKLISGFWGEKSA